MIWLVGNRGMLGTEVERLLRERGLAYVATDVELDITSPAAVEAFAAEHRPDLVINCAAYTAVDRAEEEEDVARSINADGPENLARALPDQSRFIHVSTDYVFDGRATAPIPEDTSTRPLGAYGRTKAEGERRIAAATDRHFIVRTAWLYGVHGGNFVATMLRLMAERDEIRVVADQHGAPTYAVDLADALVRLARSDSRAYGLYHFTNAGETTWHGFALAVQGIATRRGILASGPGPARGTDDAGAAGGCTVRAIPTSEYATPAVRPAYSVLSTDRIARLLDMTIPAWQDGLERYFDQLQKETT